MNEDNDGGEPNDQTEDIHEVSSDENNENDSNAEAT